MSRYIDKDKLLDDLNWHAPSEYTAKISEVITKQPEADVVEMNDIMIVSIYDGGYNFSTAVNGKQIFEHDGSNDELHRVWEAFDYPVDKRKVLQIMNEYNASKLILCEDGCIEIFEKRGNELCKTL